MKAARGFGIIIILRGTFDLLQNFDVKNDGPFRVEFHAPDLPLVTSRNGFVHFLEHLLEFHATCVNVVAIAREECGHTRHGQQIRVSGMHLQEELHEKAMHSAPI